MMSLAAIMALAAIAAPARAQVRALPSVTHAQYGVPVLPCVENPAPQPEQGAERLPNDGDCGRPPVEPPVVQPRPLPLPLPCMPGDCGTTPPHRDPDPCWYDDCPGGGGLGGRYRIQKEALRGGDFAAKQGALNALFDNMSAKASAEGAVYAGNAATSRPSLAPAVLAGSGETARRAVGFVPVPFAATPAVPHSAAWGLFGAGMLAFGGFFLGGRGGSRVVLASDDDEHTDRNSQRNNPQRDPDVERGWNQNQARHRDEETVKNSSSTITNGDNWTNGNNVPPFNGGGRAAPPPRWTPPARPVGR